MSAVCGRLPLIVATSRRTRTGSLRQLFDFADAIDIGFDDLRSR